MPSKKLAAFALASALAAFSPCLADEMTMIQSAKPVTHVYAGRNIDILGIKLGMAPNEVAEIIKAAYGMDPEVQKGTIGINFNGIQMQAQPFIQTMSASKDGGNDRVDVTFAYPSTGGGVVGMERKVQFPNSLTAPTIDSMFDQLHAKYGPGSLPKPRTFVVGLTFESWALGNNLVMKCPFDNCETAYGRLDPGSGAVYTASVKKGVLINIQASVHSIGADPSRASGLDVAIDDDENKLLSIQEMENQLKLAAEEAYRKNAVAAAPPKL